MLIIKCFESYLKILSTLLHQVILNLFRLKIIIFSHSQQVSSAEDQLRQRQNKWATFPLHCVISKWWFKKVYHFTTNNAGPRRVWVLRGLGLQGIRKNIYSFLHSLHVDWVSSMHDTWLTDKPVLKGTKIPFKSPWGKILNEGIPSSLFVICLQLPSNKPEIWVSKNEI